MNGKSKSALGLVIAVASLMSIAPGHAAVVLGGKGAPQSEACKAAGGTEDGQMCVLENGQACQSMGLARDNVCLDADGNVVEDGPDTGSNMAPDDSADEGGDE